MRHWTKGIGLVLVTIGAGLALSGGVGDMPHDIANTSGYRMVAYSGLYRQLGLCVAAVGGLLYAAHFLIKK